MTVRSAPGSTPTQGHRRGLLRIGVLVFAVLSMLFALPVAAEYGDESGGGGSGGGTGGGGGGGGGQPEDTTGSVYADLTLVLRAPDGSPTLEKYDVPADEDSEATTAYCVQPVSYEAVSGITPTTNPVDGRQVWVLPLQGEWLTDPPDPLPVAEIEPCDPWPQYAMFVSEVELERLNLARTDERVLDQKLADVATKLFLGSTVSLDPTGRIRIDDKTIDASPENQAIYQSLMLTGTIPGLATRRTHVRWPAGGDRTRGGSWIEQPVRRLGARGDEHRRGGEQEHAPHDRRRRVLQPDHRVPAGG